MLIPVSEYIRRNTRPDRFLPEMLAHSMLNEIEIIEQENIDVSQIFLELSFITEFEPEHYWNFYCAIFRFRSLSDKMLDLITKCANQMISPSPHEDAEFEELITEVKTQEDIAAKSETKMNLCNIAKEFQVCSYEDADTELREAIYPNKSIEIMFKDNEPEAFHRLADKVSTDIVRNKMRLQQICQDYGEVS